MLSHIPILEILNVLYVNMSGKVGLWFEGYLSELRLNSSGQVLQKLYAGDFVRIGLM